jgi:murein DD-endopeptidase MepM/ murein hydrolase activator NlpD
MDNRTFSPTLTSSPEPALSTATRYNATDDDEEILANTPVGQNSPGAFQICSPLASEEIDQLREIVSDPYNPPSPNREERHHGVDFSYYRRIDRAGIEGESVQSILSGVVAAVVYDRLPYGNLVIIETPADLLPDLLREKLKLENGKSLYTLYAHMKEEPRVELGQEVGCGQEIGLVGFTGYNVVNPHLHMETRIGDKGVTFYSMVFYDTSAMPDEMENYRRWRTSGDFVHFDPMLLFQYYLDFGVQK